METSLEGINAIGVAGLIGFGLCWIGGVATSFSLRKYATSPDAWNTALRSDPIAQRRFWTFFAFCFAGVLSGAIALFFGGFPLSN